MSSASIVPVAVVLYYKSTRIFFRLLSLRITCSEFEKIFHSSLYNMMIEVGLSDDANIHFLKLILNSNPGIIESDCEKNQHQVFDI